MIPKKALLIGLGLMIGQMNTLQSKQVVHLQPHSGAIRAEFGGKRLELLDAPATVFLPMEPPKLDSEGVPWTVDIKNMGPRMVTVVGGSRFSSRIIVGQTVHVFSNGTSYSLK